MSLAAHCPQDRLPYEPDGSRQVPLNEGSRNPQHCVTGPDELLVPATVRGDAGVMVGVTVDFDDEADFASKQVHNVIADDRLTAERNPETPAAKSCEQKGLRIRGIVAHVTSAITQELATGLRERLVVHE